METDDEEERKLVKGFAFLSEKPMIEVENIGEDQLSRLTEMQTPQNLPPNTGSHDRLRKARSGNGGTAARRTADVSRGLQTDGVRDRRG